LAEGLGERLGCIASAVFPQLDPMAMATGTLHDALGQTTNRSPDSNSLRFYRVPTIFISALKTYHLAIQYIPSTSKLWRDPNPASE